MVGIVSTIKDLCKKCYSCVRNCPVKAVKVSEGQAEVLHDRCISCGNCVRVCSQNAKYIKSDKDKVYGLLNSGEKLVACLAPSFPSAFEGLSPSKIIGGLKKLGFYQVREVALGAQMIAKEYENYLLKHKGTVISSPCPAIVNLIEKHYPDLLPYLIPVVSPAEALARFIKTVEGKEVKTVFIGPCVAKKEEGENSGYIDIVLTFDELKEIFDEKNIVLESVEESKFCGLKPLPAPRAFAISGGLLNAIGAIENILYSDVLIVEGKDDCISLLESLREKKISPRFVDILFCKGCIDGPILKNNNVYNNHSKVSNYIIKDSVGYESLQNDELIYFNKINLYKKYFNKQRKLSVPDEMEIKKILAYTGKVKPEDELNCGACGYNSCRDKAIAVYQGIAEIDMCLPYLLETKSKELDTITQLNEELDAIIESSYDGIWVADGQGNALKVNKAFADILGMKQEELLNKNAIEFEKQKILYPSVTLLVLREKRRVTLIQETSNNKKLLTTGNPIMDENGNVKMVMVNVRDLSVIEKHRSNIKETEKIKRYFESREGEKNYQDKKVIAFSEEMEKVLNLANKVAAVNSTVLILGESGVGKEVISRYIHRHSKRKDGPFVKINCGAIPETLLESELFGYETGAFTGAKRQGKPGLIEMAHKGTLFLDEIAEMPLNLQVKLLQVIQEHNLVRIGGIKAINVDIRIIAATNRNLEKMIKEGKFREDLFYRLNVVPITIPPLRQRKDDIIPLIYHFLDKYNHKYQLKKSINKEAKRLLYNYHWPGNVRELENVIERLVVTSEGDLITPEHVSNIINSEEDTDSIIIKKILPLKDAVEEVERKLLQKAMKRCKSTYEIAELLGVNQSTIVRKMKKYIKS